MIKVRYYLINLVAHVRGLLTSSCERTDHDLPHGKNIKVSLAQLYVRNTAEERLWYYLLRPEVCLAPAGRWCVIGCPLVSLIAWWVRVSIYDGDSGAIMNSGRR
jgi:hypothetical protein